MKFGQKLKLKKDMEHNDFITFEKGDIFSVIFYTVKYGMKLHIQGIGDAIKFKYDHKTRESRIEEYFEVIEDYDDRLAELEAVILQHYLDKGYKLEKDQEEDDVKWSFVVRTNTTYKNKGLEVIFYIDGDGEVMYYDNQSKTTKDMFDAAIEHFSAPWCDTMQRPKKECGCPDCGSSLIDFKE